MIAAAVRLLLAGVLLSAAACGGGGSGGGGGGNGDGSGNGSSGASGGASGAVSPPSPIENVVNPGSAPTANAGTDATYNGGEIAMLDGTGSSDPDGDPLRYTWTQTGGTNLVQLSDSHAARPLFEVPVADDTLTFSLVVNDGYSNSAPSSVAVITRNYYGARLAPLTNSPFRGNFSWSNGSARAALSGNDAFVPAGVNGIAAVDIADPPALVQAGTYTGSSANAEELAIIGGYAYSTSYDATFGNLYVQAVNISDPAAMSPCCYVMTRTSTAGGHLAAAGSVLYVAADTLYVLPIPDPSNPLTVGAPSVAVSLPSPAQDIAISGNYALVADGASGLKIVDISNATGAAPTAPIVGTYATAAAAQGVAAAGGYAYVAQGTAGLAIVDIGTPSAPALAGTISAPAGVAVTHVDVAGSNVFFSTDFDVWVYDASTPAAPTLAGNYRAGNLVRGIKVAGGYAYVTDTQGLRAIPVAKPSLPRGTPLHTVAGTVQQMRVYGDLGFVRTSGRVDILDLRNARAPALLSSYTDTTAGSIMGMAIVDNFAYLAQGSTVQLLRFRNPVAAAVANSVSVGSGAQTIVANDAFAYVYRNAFPSANIGIFDVSNPYTPVARGTLGSPYGTANWLRSMAVKGGQLYLTELSTGGTFRVADVSNPDAPTLLGGGLGPVDLYGIAFRADYVYAIGNNTGVKVIDASTPSSPVFVGSGYAQKGYTVSVGASRVYANSDFVGGGVRILDASDPIVPTLAGELTPAGGADNPVERGEYLYTWYNGQGGAELHVSERAPMLAARYVTGSVGSTLNYSVSWTDAAGGDDQGVKCRVTGGTCLVGAIDQASDSATVTWTLPGAAGDHEIEFAVGNGHYFNTVKDRVTVQ